MKRLARVLSACLVVVAVVGCGSYDPPGVEEPMTESEIQRYRDELYIRMNPAQRAYYESLPTRAKRDAYLVELGVLKERSKRRR